MERVGDLIKSSKPQQHSGGQSIIARASSKNSLAWVQKLERMATDMRQDWVPGQISYWVNELEQYTDDEIIVALGLYTGEFFPNVKQIKGIMERKRELRSEEAKRGQWDKWKSEDAQGKRATQEEIDAMVAGCKRAWERVVNGRDGGAETNSSKGLAKAPATLADSESA